MPIFIICCNSIAFVVGDFNVLMIFQYVTGPHGTYTQMAYPQTSPLITQMTQLEVRHTSGTETLFHF